MASVNNIQRFRQERGWSRPHLAQRMKTSPQQIERLEKGERSLSQQWIDRAADAFGVPPGDIISPEAGQNIEPSNAPQQLSGIHIKLDVLLPDIDALTDMFEGLLKACGRSRQARQLARQLAERLPTALSKI